MVLTRRNLLWAVAALLGIAVTAALTWSVSRLAGQRIGLSSEPLSVIQGLAPPRPAPVDKDPQSGSPRPARRSSAGTSTVAAPTAGVGATSGSPASPLALPTTSAPVAPAGSTQTPAAPKATAAVASSGGGSRPSGESDHHDDSGGNGSGGSQSGRDD